MSHQQHSIPTHDPQSKESKRVHGLALQFFRLKLASSQINYRIYNYFQSTFQNESSIIFNMPTNLDIEKKHPFKLVTDAKSPGLGSGRLSGMPGDTWITGLSPEKSLGKFNDAGNHLNKLPRLCVK